MSTSSVLGSGDSACFVVWEGFSVCVFFSGALLARTLSGAVCSHLGLHNTSTALFDERCDEWLDEEHLVFHGARLQLRHRPALLLRVWATATTDASSCSSSRPLWWRGALVLGAHDSVTDAVLSRLGLALQEEKKEEGWCLAEARSGRVLSPLETAAELRRDRAEEEVFVLVARRRSAEQCTVLQHPAQQGWILSGRLLVAASPGVTGRALLEAVRPGEECSLMQSGKLVNLDEPLVQDSLDSMRLDVKVPEEDHRAVMRAAAAAFSEATQYNLLRGEGVVHKIPNVTHSVRRVGPVEGTLVLTAFRIVFIAHNRST